MASAHAVTFIENVTGNDLKMKLEQLGLDTTGNKATLKLRLLEAVKKLPDVRLNQYFPENSVNATNHEAEDQLLNSNNERNPIGALFVASENLEEELEELRRVFAKKQEIAELRRKISELSAAEDTSNTRPQFPFRDVEESFVSFSADNSYPVQKWIMQFEESADLLEWDSKTRFIYVKRLMSSTAKLFIRTTTAKTWPELKNALIGEFGKRVSSAEIHEQLRKRQKKNENDLRGDDKIKDIEYTELIYDILNIDTIETNTFSIDINEKLSHVVKDEVKDIVLESFNSSEGSLNNTESNVKLSIRLTKDEPFYCTPRRIPYAHKERLKEIIDDLLKRGIIRESSSPYASPIVLVAKKNRELRLCIDYRVLNKYTIRDNYPMPLIEDLLDRLRGRRYFSVLDLKSGFHHVDVTPDSIKYTSFVTPVGQYEYLKMPFGLKNAPSVFQRYIHNIFKELIGADKLVVYMDDILLGTETMQEHFSILEKVMTLIKENSLKLRLDKCKFLYEEIVFLGYVVNSKGIRPNDENLRAIKDFPIRKCIKGVHSFLGLASYFRKFVKNFAVIAKPLYDLLKKDATFKFGPLEHKIFETLKHTLLDAPILALYSPTNETELHCDASGSGFGSILLQKQSDGKFHPVFYFSKRTTEVESKYHSYELETLSIIYALRRFRTYLLGISFKIVTDCQTLTLTLNKQILNPRISRWALELQEHDFKLEHRVSSRMNHVDALSRGSVILNIEETSFDHALAVAQLRDPVITEILADLEKQDSSKYALINGLVYRKHNSQVMFYVPQNMEECVIQVHHEALCHLGANKCFEYLRKTYWFPGMKGKITNFIKGCLKCAYYSSKSGKVEGTLHSIPKGNAPFAVIHVDHYGPLSDAKNRNKHILVIVDGFTKFTKLFAVKSTTTKEVIDCLILYFTSYSRPSKIITDRGTCFISTEFAEFCSKNNVVHFKVATHTPQSNGQVERINRLLTPMLSKETEPTSTANWSEKLIKVEYALNNTVNRSTGFTPSQLLFGVEQKGEYCDGLREYLNKNEQNGNRDLTEVRQKASNAILRAQNYNKTYYDQKHKAPRKYSTGDLVMIKNIVTTPGINKKLLPKFRGSYEIVKVLENDRYIIKDVEGFQVSRLLYKGVCSPANMKPYVF